MSLKIEIPETSDGFKEWLWNYLQSERFTGFWDLMGYVSGEAQGVHIHSTCGGCLPYDDWHTSHQDKPLIEEYRKFHKDGYSEADFQHIFMDAYLDVAISLAMNGRPVKHDNWNTPKKEG